MMVVIKGRTTGADRPPAPAQTIEDQIAIAVQWAAVSPPMQDIKEATDHGKQ